MKVLTNKCKTTMVMSESSDKCPRLSVVNISAKLKDDYSGRIRIKSRLLRKISRLK